MLFILVATTFPMISEAFWDEKVTVGPPYYKAWVQPHRPRPSSRSWASARSSAGRRRAREALRRAFRCAARRARSPRSCCTSPRRTSARASPPSSGATRSTRARSGRRSAPSTRSRRCSGFSLCVFNIAVIVQEFAMLFRSRAQTRRRARPTPAILWYAGLCPGFRATRCSPCPRHRGGATAGTSCTSASCSCSSASPGSRGPSDKEASLSPGQTLPGRRLQARRTWASGWRSTTTSG